MKTIYKYQLKIINTQIVEMHRGAKILHVGSQEGSLCIWAEVDTSYPTRPFVFDIVGTGHTLTLSSGTCKYLGTVQMPPYVWHVYGGPKPE